LLEGKRVAHLEAFRTFNQTAGVEEKRVKNTRRGERYSLGALTPEKNHQIWGVIHEGSLT